MIAPAEEAHRLAGDIAAAEAFVALARGALPREHAASEDLDQAAACIAMAMQRARALVDALRSATPPPARPSGPAPADRP